MNTKNDQKSFSYHGAHLCNGLKLTSKIKKKDHFYSLLLHGSFKNDYQKNHEAISIIEMILF